MLIIVLAVLTFLAVLNAIVPLPGFSFFVPLLATVMPTQDALTFVTIYFLISSSIIVCVFRKYLRRELIILLLPASIIGALAGSIFSASLNEKLLTTVIFVFVLYFLIKKIRDFRQPTQTTNKPNQKERHSSVFVGLVSGFFQGGGLGGGDVRNGFLFAKGLTLQEVRATTAAVGVGNFLVATIVRGTTGHIVVEQVWVFLVLIPLLIGATYIARHITTRISPKIQNVIIIGLMSIAVVSLIIQLLQ